MVPRTVQGLPAHPLIIHVPVILGPLLGLLCVLMLVPALRHRLHLWAAGLGILFALSTVVAVESGENLLQTLQLGSSIDAHEHAGELLRTIAVVLAVLLVVFAVMVRRLGPRLVTLGAVVIAVVGVGEIAQVVKTGHEGAKLVWLSRYQEAVKLQNGG